MSELSHNKKKKKVRPFDAGYRNNYSTVLWRSIFYLALLLSTMILIFKFVDITVVVALTWVFGIIAILFDILYGINAFMYISENSTDRAVIVQSKQFTGKVIEGGLSFINPLLQKLVVYSTQIQTIWVSFLGPRGKNKVQVIDFRNYRKQYLDVDQSIFYIENQNELFNSNDFYRYGSLKTADKEELNAICSISFRIIDPLKLSKVFNQNQNDEAIKGKYKEHLATKLVSGFRSSSSRMTLDEFYEERTKLMELLDRDEISTIRDDWGLDVINISIEEIFLEDETFQNMLDEKKKAEIKGEVEQLKAENTKVIKNIQVKAEEGYKTQISRAHAESRIIQEETRRDVALLKRDLMKIHEETNKTDVVTTSKIRKMIAEAEANKMTMLNSVMDEKIIQKQLIDIIPLIVDQLSLEAEKFIIVPSEKQSFLPPLLTGNHQVNNEEEY